jgi:hypothetical protein
MHYDPFFYPLDHLGSWPAFFYGSRGFLQWQCIMPGREQASLLADIIMRIRRSKVPPSYCVVKNMGDMPAAGMLSFPRSGLNVVVEFPNRGTHLFQLLDELDNFVIAHGGRVYPAKDARMSAMTFQASYPDSEAFKQYIDPMFSSSFYKRVSQPSRVETPVLGCPEELSP